MSVIYLDNNATTSVAPEVFESMIPFFTEKYGNASSMHTFGGQVGKSIQDAREKVAAMLGAQPEEIVFTSCGTESDSTAVMSALQAQPEKKHVITTRVEHSALIALGQHLEQKGYELTYLGVDSKGRLDLDELSDAMRKDTAIVSIMFANNETGTVFPIQKIAEMVKERGILFHTYRPPASFLLIWPRCRWTFWRFPGTSSTPPRGSECCMSARERGSSRFFAAGIRKGGVAPARKMRRTS